jgi:endonuclease G, mitochondrial
MSFRIFRAMGFLSLLLLSQTLFSQGTFGPTHFSNISENTSSENRSCQLEVPAITDSQNVIHHFGYSLSYNKRHEQANWVAYLLTKERATSLYSRANHFIPDPIVITGTADDFDYRNSGYDRGHLAPAADMGWSSTAMAESFFYSNMSPQLPGFNRGVWKRLEELVRYWALDYDSLFITTGPVLEEPLPSIGSHHVSVPRYYYKAILRLGAHPEAIAFILPNQSSSETLQTFAVSVDSLERLTGINFFSALPDELEETLESNVEVDGWRWKRQNNDMGNIQVDLTQITKPSEERNAEALSSNNKRTNVVQCSAITKAGRRCLRMTTNGSATCWQHSR